MTIIAIIAYVVTIGLVYRRSEANWRRKATCHRDSCRGPVGSGVCTYHSGIQILWFGIGLVWPMALPFTIGLSLHDRGWNWSEREERKHQREVKKAENMAELAVIRLREAKALQEAAEIQGENNILNLAMNRK